RAPPLRGGGPPPPRGGPPAGEGRRHRPDRGVHRRRPPRRPAPLFPPARAAAEEALTVRTALALAWLTFLGAQPAPPPNAVVLRDGAATLALAGDRAEKNVVSLRYSATLRLTVTVEGGEELAVSAFTADVDDKVWKVVRQTPGDFTGPGDARRWQKEMEL